jgi:ABC-type nitrate/sulfonate/bicarbonate transport system substrate-binding protein
MSRIYKVTLKATAAAVRYVRADNGARALRAVTGELYDVDVVSTEELWEAMKASAGTVDVLDATDPGVSKAGWQA